MTQARENGSEAARSVGPSEDSPQESRREPHLFDPPEEQHRRALTTLGLGDHLSRQVMLAQAVLTGERLWPCLVPSLLVVALFLTLAWFDILPFLPYWAHLGVLLALLAAVLGLLVWRGRRLILPSSREGQRRLEQDSAIPHRPFTTIADRPINATDPQTDALWLAHRQQARESLSDLRLGLPDMTRGPGLPLAPQAALLLALIVAIIIGWGDLGPRLGRALTPGSSNPFLAGPARLDLWITPPDYTGRAPIFLSGGEGNGRGAVGGTASGGERGAEEGGNTKAGGRAWLEPPRPSADTSGVSLTGREENRDQAASTPPHGLEADGTAIRLPAGSTLKARILGGYGQPVLHLDDQVWPFEDLGNGGAQGSGGWSLETVLPPGEDLWIAQNRQEVGRWTLRQVPDYPPVAQFIRDPAANERTGVLRVAYQALDDYGVESVAVEIAPDADEPLPAAAELLGIGGPEAPPLSRSLPLPTGDRKKAEGLGYHDLTDHVLAGMPVTLTLVARDAAGQEGRSAPQAMRLPERRFTHPVAQAVVEARRRLIMAPDQHEGIADIFLALADEPAAFSQDTTTYLALRSIAYRLLPSPRAETFAPLLQLMWDTALGIEDGGLSMAQRELRRAQAALEEALANGAPEEEIERLMNALEAAVAKYMQAMQQEMMRQLEQGEVTFVPVPESLLNMQDIGSLLEQMRTLNRTGAREATRQMLDQLKDMMENLQMIPMQGQMANTPQGQGASEMLQQMDSLIQGQQSLMDQTFGQGQQPYSGRGGAPQPSPGSRPQDQAGQGQAGRSPWDSDRAGPGRRGQTPGRGGAEGDNQRFRQGLSALRQQQEVLRRQLGDVMRRFGEGNQDIPVELGRAEQAMRRASSALQQGQPNEAAQVQGEALDQLQRGLQAMLDQMSQQMQAGSQGGPQGSNGLRLGRSPGAQGRDPLGRLRSDTQGSGFDDSGVDIPEQDEIRRAREILEELRRRASEWKRPPIERNYLRRLLERF